MLKFRTKTVRVDQEYYRDLMRNLSDLGRANEALTKELNEYKTSFRMLKSALDGAERREELLRVKLNRLVDYIQSISHRQDFSARSVGEELMRFMQSWSKPSPRSKS